MGGGIDLGQYTLNYSSVLLADTYVFKTFKFGSRVKEHQETSHTVGIISKRSLQNSSKSLFIFQF